jgi:hypothetical protein
MSGTVPPGTVFEVIITATDRVTHASSTTRFALTVR